MVRSYRSAQFATQLQTKCKFDVLIAYIRHHATNHVALVLQTMKLAFCNNDYGEAYKYNSHLAELCSSGLRGVIQTDRSLVADFELVIGTVSMHAV
mmetsp:Transcript_9472/g.30246  ORF Transcript_9472/g.30246 Transcript_9472/m.30246 type:complete len:96 (-) Transcript_9472:236-523(-)